MSVEDDLRRLGARPPKSNGPPPESVYVDVGKENIDHAMELCSKALEEIFEECAKRFEAAIEAENTLHDETVKELTENAALCRRKGKESSDWLKGRGATVNEVVANAQASLKSLGGIQ